MSGTAEFQVANALSAIAACRAYGLSRENIAHLQTFRAEANNPGGNNLFRVGQGYALVDYGHNPGAFEAVCRMAARWQGKRATGIIGVPGDRDDRIIKTPDASPRRGFERVIIRDDADTRGRKRGEVVRLLCETVTKESPDCRCDVVLDEIEAFSQVLQEMEKDEVVVIFYDKLEPVLDVLRRHQAVAVSPFEDTRAASKAVLT